MCTVWTSLNVVLVLSCTRFRCACENDDAIAFGSVWSVQFRYTLTNIQPKT